MATGKPPWSHRTNPISVFMEVGNGKNPPYIPEELSDSARDFILLCFKRNPSERPNVKKLL
jgi:mitogen-activated protein kinase kinase kinase 5